MANARKCDRCGVYFDPQFQNLSYQTTENLREHKCFRLFYNDSNSGTFVDLCPSCTAAFEKFIVNADTDKVKDPYEILDELSEMASKKHSSFGDAKQLLHKLNETISRYGYVSVLDYVEYAGLDTHFGLRYSKYGWRDLSDANIRGVYKMDPNGYYTKTDHWIIEMPRPVKLDA